MSGWQSKREDISATQAWAAKRNTELKKYFSIFRKSQVESLAHVTYLLLGEVDPAG